MDSYSVDGLMARCGFGLVSVFTKCGSLLTRLRHARVNSHCQVLFKNPRDQTQVRTVAQQMHPSNCRAVVDAFEDATEPPYSYMLFDYRPETPDHLRMRSGVFEDDSAVYVPIKDQRGAGRRRK
jgi:hypothetical protein